MANQTLVNTCPLGFWDLRISPMTIGGLLTLLAELKVLGEIHQFKEVEIGIIDVEDKDPILSNFLGDKSWTTLTDSQSCENNLMLSMIFDMEGVKACHLFKTGSGPHWTLGTGFKQAVFVSVSNFSKRIRNVA